MKVVGVTSGKGGVGKTTLSANLAIEMARQNKRVLVFDADFGLANLDVVLGVKPVATLEHVLNGTVPLEGALTPGPSNIKFIAGGSGVKGLIDPRPENLAMFLDGLERISDDFDFVLVDTGAGIDAKVMLFLQGADEVIVIATPDPSSIVDAYATIKVLLSRGATATIRLVVNMAGSAQEAETVHKRLNDIVRQFLKAEVCFLGFVRKDDNAWECARRRTPVVLANPSAPAALDLALLARRVTSVPAPRQSQGWAERLRTFFGRKAA